MSGYGSGRYGGQPYGGGVEDASRRPDILWFANASSGSWRSAVLEVLDDVCRQSALSFYEGDPSDSHVPGPADGVVYLGVAPEDPFQSKTFYIWSSTPDPLGYYAAWMEPDVGDYSKSPERELSLRQLGRAFEAWLDSLASDGTRTPAVSTYDTQAARLGEALAWVIHHRERALLDHITVLEGSVATAQERIKILEAEVEHLQQARTVTEPRRKWLTQGAATVIAAVLGAGVGVGGVRLAADSQVEAARIAAEAQIEAAEIAAGSQSPSSPAAQGPTVEEVIDLADEVITLCGEDQEDR